MRPTSAGGRTLERRAGTAASDPRLRWYPRPWRTRYGVELTALLDEEYGDKLPRKVRLGLVTGGLQQRARQSGLVGDSVSAADGMRAGALVVLAAWTAFVIAGASFAKFSEQFDEALPHSSGVHRVPDLAFTVLQTVAGVAGLLVVAGRFSLSLRSCDSCERAVGPRCAGISCGRSSAPPSSASSLWHSRLGTPSHITATKQRSPLVRGALPALGTPRGGDLGAVDRGRGRSGKAGRALEGDSHRGGRSGRCPHRGDGGHGRRDGGLVGCHGDERAGILESSPGGAPGSPWDLWLVATVVLMLVAVGAAVLGVAREVRVWTTIRSA